jgi:predicted metal-dependent hydrolase
MQLSTEQLIIDSDLLVYKLVRSLKRKRSISLRVLADGGVQVNSPFGMKLATIEAFIISKYSWLQKKQDQKKNHCPLIQPQYISAEKHLFMGCEYPLQITRAKISSVKLVDNVIHICHRKNASIKNLLKAWYRQQALDYFVKRTQLFALSNHLPKIKAIKVRYMKARWGSCSSDAIITYNVHLIKAPPESIDYVVLHELCHLLHPNHSAAFYRSQSQLNPGWKTQKQQLNKLNISFSG